jgi:uncharacterized damage-inducible protein DinB
MAQMAQELEGLKYPVGKFEYDRQSTPAKRSAWLTAIESLPGNMKDAVAGLSDAQLDTPYRDGGWTLRQVVHHVADSHMNAYVRLKLALTEESPAIKPYDEKLWAELPDSRLSVEVSIALLEMLHARWSVLLRSLKNDTWARTWRHPEHGERTLDYLLQLYAWHSRHHVGHVRSLRERKGW